NPAGAGRTAGRNCFGCSCAGCRPGGRKCLRFSARERLKFAMKAVTRCAVVLIAICSWFAMSNHCAFAAVATKTDSPQTECPFHSKPAKQKQEPSRLQCCKILRAVVFAQTKSWARDDAKFFDLDLCVEEFPLVESFPNAQASLSL